jgi:hypothetical protein
MKKEVWILLGILALVLLFSYFRESFEATPSIQKPPFSGAELDRVFNMLSNAEQAAYKDAAKQKDSTLKDPTKQATQDAGNDLNPVMKKFYDDVYGPAPGPAPLTETDIDTFLKTNPPATNKIDFKALIKRYFIDQRGVGTAEKSGYAAELASLGQTTGYTTPGPTGVSSSSSTSTASDVTSATGPTGTTGATQETTSGTTTGGSSTSSMGPNNLLPSTSGIGVFGPTFTGFGETATAYANGGDSSKTTKYPELLGGGDRAPSTRIEGVGIVQPSKNYQLIQDLPGPDQTGSSEQSQFLPYSRSPGDLDKIPDPYRVSQSYKPSSYSYKYDPVPFLTDFSAFQK